MEAIDPNFEFLDVLYEAGTSPSGRVWSRPNAVFDMACRSVVSLRPDVGTRVHWTSARSSIGACNCLGILIDLSHLNERGFLDVAAISKAPLGSPLPHSNAHAFLRSAFSKSYRQSTGLQSGKPAALVGVNLLATSFLRRDGRHDVNTHYELVIKVPRAHSRTCWRGRRRLLGRISTARGSRQQ